MTFDTYPTEEYITDVRWSWGMKYAGTRTNTATLAPLALHVLSEPAVQAADSAAGSSRPLLGVYNLAFSNAIYAIERVVAAAKPIYTTIGREAASELVGLDGELVKATQDALHELTAYYDQLSVILGRFFLESEKKLMNKAKEMLEARTRSYRASAAFPINRIKHAGCGLSSTLYFYPGPHPGWYVDGYVDGSVGPDPDVHSEVLSFSFARTLRAWIVGVADGADALGECILNRVGFERSKLARSTRPAQAYLDLIHDISRLPFVFFPDEVKLDTPCVVFLDKGNHISIRLEMNGGSSASRRYIPKEADLMHVLRADGVSKKFTMPHRG